MDFISTPFLLVIRNHLLVLNTSNLHMLRHDGSTNSHVDTFTIQIIEFLQLKFTRQKCICS